MSATEHMIRPEDMPPDEIIEAASLVSDWMAENGHDRYELCNICSRNFAEDTRRLTFELNRALAELNELRTRLHDLIDAGVI